MLHSLDLFSGYGGIALALKDYARPIGYCEIEPYARALLNSRIESGDLPEAPIYPDVRKLRGQLGVADLITGGFPCQDLSVAGNGAGLAGERSGLFFEIIRLTEEIRPAFVFLENVPAIRTRGLEQVVEAFTKIRYDCRWTCLSASSLGAPHKRERWFLLAHSNSSNLWPQSRGSPRTQGQEKIEPRINGKNEPIANPLCKGLERASRQESKLTEHLQLFANTNGNRMEGPRPKQQATGANKHLANYWEQVKPPVFGVDDGGSFKVDRIKCLGNGVVPIQVKTAFEKLMGLTKFN